MQRLSQPGQAYQRLKPNSFTRLVFILIFVSLQYDNGQYTFLQKVQKQSQDTVMSEVFIVFTM